MIARTWRGATRAEDAERYADYIRRTGLVEYAATPGSRGAFVLHRVEDSRAYFLVVSLWDSLDDIRAFAGDDISRAVFYPEDDRYLVERELVAEHWQVTDGAVPAIAEDSGSR